MKNKSLFETEAERLVAEWGETTRMFDIGWWEFDTLARAYVKIWTWKDLEGMYDSHFGESRLCDFLDYLREVA